MKKPYIVRYSDGDKAIEISKDHGSRIWVDCDDVGWKEPDPRTLAAAIAHWLNHPDRKFPTLLAAETARCKAVKSYRDSANLPDLSNQPQ